MKLTIWGINYSPEPTGIAPYNTDLAEFMAARGHEVSAISAFPYYPHWKKRKEDERTWSRTESLNGVNLKRCWCYVPSKVTTPARIIHELSFSLHSFIQAIRMPAPDVYVVISPPLALGFFGWLAARIKRRPFIFHVQDLQPDAAVGLGMMKNGPIIRILYALEKFSYAKATRVSSISKGILTAFSKKGVPEAKQILFPNWLRGNQGRVTSAEERQRIRAKYGIEQTCFLALYSGNIGKKQNLEQLCDAGRYLESLGKSHNVMIVIAGDGAGKKALEQSLADKPVRCLKTIPLLNDSEYETMMATADVSLITQASGSGQYFFPSKLLSALASRSPVVAVADLNSELAQAVKEGQFGRTVACDDIRGLANTLIELSEKPEQLQLWKAGTNWVERYNQKAVLGKFENELHKLVFKQDL